MFCLIAKLVLGTLVVGYLAELLEQDNELAEELSSYLDRLR